MKKPAKAVLTGALIGAAVAAGTAGLVGAGLAIAESLERQEAIVAGMAKGDALYGSGVPVENPFAD